jgi:hypothetical protein
MACSTIDKMGGLSCKHPEIMYRTFLHHVDFSQMAIDYRSTDLDYKIQEKDHKKKAVLGHRMACSTINKMGSYLKTLGDGVWDLPGPKLSWPNINIPLIH